MHADKGTPVTGAQVAVIYARATARPDEWPLTARTDARGEVEFTLADGGPWLVRAVHMIRRAERTGTDAADWDRSGHRCRLRSPRTP